MTLVSGRRTTTRGPSSVWVRLIRAEFVRRRTTLASVRKALLLAAALLALVSCDPGYTMQIHNGCAVSMRMHLLADPGTDVERYPNVVVVAAHDDVSYSMIEEDDKSAAGVLLISGPRSGDVVRATDNAVVIPRDACPSP